MFRKWIPKDITKRMQNRIAFYVEYFMQIPVKKFYDENKFHLRMLCLRAYYLFVPFNGFFKFILTSYRV